LNRRPCRVGITALDGRPGARNGKPNHLFPEDLFALVVPHGDFFAGDFFALSAFAGDFLVLVAREAASFLLRTGSILAAPAPGANKLSCPSFHLTR